MLLMEVATLAEVRPEQDAPPAIDERTLDYSVRAVRLYRALQSTRDPAAWEIGKQYLRAATSIGANVAEAQGAESSRDFVHKLGIALKEAKESGYWLQLLDRTDILSSERLADIEQETSEIQAVLATIIVKVKKRQGR
jgi:four helix bundle protein